MHTSTGLVFPNYCLLRAVGLPAGQGRTPPDVRQRPGRGRPGREAGRRPSPDVAGENGRAAPKRGWRPSAGFGQAPRIPSLSARRHTPGWAGRQGIRRQGAPGGRPRRRCSPYGKRFPGPCGGLVLAPGASSNRPLATAPTPAFVRRTRRIAHARGRARGPSELPRSATPASSSRPGTGAIPGLRPWAGCSPTWARPRLAPRSGLE